LPIVAAEWIRGADSRLFERWDREVDRLVRGLDRLSHSHHRRRAKKRVCELGRPNRILVVCTGNIFRSPYAAELLRTVLERTGSPNIQVESAGFIDPGRPADGLGLSHALLRGIDISQHRSRLVLAEDAVRFDVILAMTRHHRNELIRRFAFPHQRIFLLGDFDGDDPPEREIPDPFGVTADVFQKIFEQIDRSVRGLAEILTTLPK
jgi:protein-tyrosine phosphatase